MNFFFEKKFAFKKGPGDRAKSIPSAGAPEAKNAPQAQSEGLSAPERRQKLAQAQEMFLSAMTPKQAAHIYQNYEKMLAKMNPQAAANLLSQALKVHTETTEFNTAKEISQLFKAMSAQKLWDNVAGVRPILINILRQPVAAKIIATGRDPETNEDFGKNIPPKIWNQIQSKAKQLSKRQ